MPLLVLAMLTTVFVEAVLPELAVTTTPLFVLACVWSVCVWYAEGINPVFALQILGLERTIIPESALFPSRSLIRTISCFKCDWLLLYLRFNIRIGLVYCHYTILIIFMRNSHCLITSYFCGDCA